MKKRWNRLRNDAKQYGKGILLAAVYLLFIGVGMGLPVCPMVYITGFPCPACGMTRAACLFLKGDFSGAYQMHPFFYVLLLLVLLAVWMRYVRMGEIRWMQWLVVLAAVGMTGFYFYRMWRFFPGQEPMVYYENSMLGWIKKLHIIEKYASINR